MSDKPRFCVDCKHYRYDSNAAHQNRCDKFKDGEGKAHPIALVRHSDKHCGDKHWEPHA